MRAAAAARSGIVAAAAAGGIFWRKVLVTWYLWKGDTVVYRFDIQTVEGKARDGFHFVESSVPLGVAWRGVPLHEIPGAIVPPWWGSKANQERGMSDENFWG